MIYGVGEQGKAMELDTLKKCSPGKQAFLHNALKSGHDSRNTKYLGSTLKPLGAAHLVDHCSREWRAVPTLQHSWDSGTLTLHGPPPWHWIRTAHRLSSCK